MNPVKRICVAQISIEPGEVQKNLKKIVGVIERARKNDLVVFPELVVHGHVFSKMPRKDILSVVKQTPKFDKVHRAAEKHRVRVIIGSMMEEEGHLYNVAVFLGRKRIQIYRKTHVHWTESFDPGTELVTFDSSLDKIGPLICFDAAFPEAARTLSLKGARILAVIAAVPRTFDAQVMKRRIEAMAVMNQVFVIYANRGGESFTGGSGVWDPTGDVVGRVGTGEHLLEVQIDLRQVDEWREREPLYPHRRADLYDFVADTAAAPVRPIGSVSNGSGTRRRKKRSQSTR